MFVHHVAPGYLKEPAGLCSMQWGCLAVCGSTHISWRWDIASAILSARLNAVLCVLLPGPCCWAQGDALARTVWPHYVGCSLVLLCCLCACPTVMCHLRSPSGNHISPCAQSEFQDWVPPIQSQHADISKECLKCQWDRKDTIFFIALWNLATCVLSSHKGTNCEWNTPAWISAVFPSPQCPSLRWWSLPVPVAACCTPLALGGGVVVQGVLLHLRTVSCPCSSCQPCVCNYVADQSKAFLAYTAMLTGLPGDVLWPWKLVTCKCYPCLTVYWLWSPSSCRLHLLMCTAGNLQPLLPAARRLQLLLLQELGHMVLLWQAPGAQLWSSVCAWRQHWLQLSSQRMAACSERRCQCFKRDELCPLNILGVAVSMEMLCCLAAQGRGLPAGWWEPGWECSRAAARLAASPGHCAEAGPCPGVAGRGGGSIWPPLCLLHPWERKACFSSEALNKNPWNTIP